MLQQTINWIMYSLMDLNSSSRLFASLNYFIYDVIKILFLMFLLISFVTFLRTYINQEKFKIWLSKGGIFSNIFASIFGAITPFCSCSSIPIYLSMIKANIPLGVSFSFLVTSPIINEYLVVLMLGFFGLKVTIAYILSGIFLGVFSGMILGRLKLEKYIIRDPGKKILEIKINYNFKKRVIFGLREGKYIIKKLWIWVLAGVALGAIIHNYIPQELIEVIVGKTGVFAVPLSVLLGIPIYANCVAILPIAVILFQKGLPLGTVLAFMMSLSALSLPEAIILKSVMKLKLLILFFSIVALGIIFTGYLFNFLQHILI
ncbi:permease [Candidatus Woesearchaeota archaeon]|nr:permease [Candidatus Woesearchaeota archaeon]